MKKIGFKNFKRFKSFAPIGISPITMLVGANNAGKSTFIKGVLLANENICNLEIPNSYYGKKKFSGYLNPMFTFDLTRHDAGVSTYDRNVNNENENGEIEFYEEFKYIDISNIKQVRLAHHNKSLSRFAVNLVIHRPDTKISGDIKYKAKVKRIIVEDKANLLRFRLDFSEKKMYVDILTTNTDEEEKLYKIEADNKKLKKSSSNREVYITPANERRQAICELGVSTEEIVSVEMPLEDIIYGKDEDWGVLVHNSIARYIWNISEFWNLFKSSNRVTPHYDNIKYSAKFIRAILKERLCAKEIQNSALSFEATVSSPLILNIHSHYVNKSALYNVLDENDYMAQTIHRYVGIADENDKKEMKKFILRWMEEFKVGKDFKIKAIEVGECYLFKVKDFNNKWQYLSDLGTGINQIMIMLLNLAIAYISSAVVIIEEPEQNLHPCFQSKLIDLFNDVETGLKSEEKGVHIEHKVSIIVETHSEYLIRRSQVIVAEKNYLSQKELEDECPYKVYYFPEEGMPYDMGYKTDGFFENKFGEGFFDIAGTLRMGLIAR